jgi:hypothetical protein
VGTLEGEIVGGMSGSKWEIQAICGYRPQLVVYAHRPHQPSHFYSDNTGQSSWDFLLRVCVDLRVKYFRLDHLGDLGLEADFPVKLARWTVTVSILRPLGCPLVLVHGSVNSLVSE